MRETPAVGEEGTAGEKDRENEGGELSCVVPDRSTARPNLVE